MNTISLIPLSGIPAVSAGSDLTAVLLTALEDIAPKEGDLLVLTHKVLSKANGLTISLSDVRPSVQAEALSRTTGKDPRLMEVILENCNTVYACDRGILIAERRDGWVCCNAGVDASNAGAPDTLVLLPEDCDSQAKRISQALFSALGFPLPVIVCDTHGRALRSGTAGVAVGAWGLEPIRSYRGCADCDGRPLMSTQEAVADELAAAATLVMGQGSEGVPAVLIRGFRYTPADMDSLPLRRPKSQRLYQPKGTPFSAE